MFPGTAAHRCREQLCHTAWNPPGTAAGGAEWKDAAADEAPVVPEIQEAGPAKEEPIPPKNISLPAGTTAAGGR